MMTTSAPGGGANLPVIPAPRDRGCPLKPPAFFADGEQPMGCNWRCGAVSLPG